MHATTKRRPVASAWHGLTAVMAALAIAAQLFLVIADVNIGFANGSAALDRRLIEFFSYFTIQSNILVGVATAMLAGNPDRDGRFWRALRLASLSGITVTLVIYHFVLSPLATFEGLAAVSNVALHYVVPALAIVGWLVFGPRDRISGSTLLLAAIWPVAYIIYTFVHGALTGFYPYPFINFNRLGIETVLTNAAGVTLLLVAVGGVYWGIDRIAVRLQRGRAR